MRVILLHGLNTTPNDKWYPWLTQEMKRQGIEFFAPALPNPSNPYIKEWTATLDKRPNEDTILIGHSRGGVAVLRWLEVQPESLKIKKVILIATNLSVKESSRTKRITVFIPNRSLLLTPCYQAPNTGHQQGRGS